MPACLPPVDKSRRLRAICCISHPRTALHSTSAIIPHERREGRGILTFAALRRASSRCVPGSVLPPYLGVAGFGRPMNARSTEVGDADERATHNGSAMEERIRNDLSANLNVQRPRFALSTD